MAGLEARARAAVRSQDHVVSRRFEFRMVDHSLLNELANLMALALLLSEIRLRVRRPGAISSLSSHGFCDLIFMISASRSASPSW